MAVAALETGNAAPLLTAQEPSGGATGTVDPGQAPSVEELKRRVEAALLEEFERQALIGLAVAVVEGESVIEFHFGHADKKAEVKVGPETLFRWASISKPLTAVLALQLERDGKLDLDMDVRKLVPEFPEKPWPITARQLLQHRAGVVHYGNGKVVRTKEDYGVEHPFKDSVRALDAFKASPLIFEPGTAHAYTTHGYMLLGATLQRAGGAPYADQIRRRIAQPAGLDSLRPDYAWEAIANRAKGYRKLAGIEALSSQADVSWKLPGGGFVSTIGDLGRFAQALMGEALLPKEVLRKAWMAQPAPEKPAGTIPYGLGFGTRTTARGPMVSHSGSQAKTRTLMQFYPGEGRAVCVMTNSEWARVAPIARAVWGVLPAPQR